MKQTKLLLATIAMLWCSLTASAHDFAVGGIYYNITSGTDLTVEVTYQGNSYDEYSNEYSGAVTIPSAVTYNGKTYRVTEIGFAAFANCSSLTVLKIPENITRIANGAFYYCSSLRSINIPEGVTAINSQAFQGCSSLTSITIPESVTSIGLQAFCFCSSLTSITIPGNVTSIGVYAFHGTAWYDNQPDGVIYINKVLYTYKGTMPANTSIEVKEGTEYIANQAFYGCSSLTAITIPESVTSIGNYAFDGCSSLTSITIPESSQLTSIGGYAFAGCSSITAITIPKSVTTIGSYAFQGCTGELFVNCNLSSAYYYDEEGTRYGIFHGSKFTKVTIGDSVTSIGDYAFAGCSSLTAITIPESVMSIGSYAFQGCTGELFVNCNLSSAYYYDEEGTRYGIFHGSKFTKVTIGDSVTSIGDYAFAGCSSLSSITIPKGVTSIGDYAFNGCSSLTSITIPKNVTSIGVFAFRGCN